jgi:hypothetical protein
VGAHPDGDAVTRYVPTPGDRVRTLGGRVAHVVGPVNPRALGMRYALCGFRLWSEKPAPADLRPCPGCAAVTP